MESNENDKSWKALEKRVPMMELPGPVQAYRQGYTPGYAPEMQEEDPHGGLIEYWHILRRRKGTVILIAFAGALLGVLVTLPQTPVYQARATLEVQELNQNFLNSRDVTPVSDGGAGYNMLADIQTQIKIIQSETLIGRTVEKLKQKMPAGYKAPEGRIAVWRKALNLPEPATDESGGDMAKAAAAALKVRASGQTRIIEILFDSTDPKQAAEFANLLVNEYIDQNVDARWKMSQRTGDWLSRQLDEMRIKLEKSEEALQNYARQSGLMFTNEKTNVSEDKLRQLQAELGKAQGERVQKQSRWEITKTAPPETLPDVLNDVSLRDYQVKLTDLKRQEAELSQTFKPEYSKVKRIKAQIASLETALARERKAITERIRNENDEALRREKLLAIDYAMQAKLVTQDAEKTVQYNILKRELDTNRQIYDSMLQRVKESSIASAMRASNIRVVDAAQVPRKPYKPSTSMNGGLGLLGGLFLGVAFVVMRERADRTIQDPGDLSYYLQVSELGVIPSDTGRVKRKLAYHSKKRQLAAAAADAETTTLMRPGVSGEAQPERVELVTWQHKPSMLAEAFRVVLTSILFTGKNGDRPRVLVLTSASPGEGKSTVVSNLAIALAEIKQRVLVIDADLRKPRQQTIFDIANERGLSNLLEERPLKPETLEGVIQETSIPGLFLLPSGPATSAAGNLLYSANLPELLAKFKSEFDMVLIDTPPMLQMPDARVIGRMADAVVLVARAGQTTRDAAVAARSRLVEDETRILGTILNNWDPKMSPGGYYGYYRGYSYRGYYGNYGNYGH